MSDRFLLRLFCQSQSCSSFERLDTAGTENHDFAVDHLFVQVGLLAAESFDI